MFFNFAAVLSKRKKWPHRWTQCFPRNMDDSAPSLCILEQSPHVFSLPVSNIYVQNKDDKRKVSMYCVRKAKETCHGLPQRHNALATNHRVGFNRISNLISRFDANSRPSIPGPFTVPSTFILNLVPKIDRVFQRSLRLGNIWWKQFVQCLRLHDLAQSK